MDIFPFNRNAVTVSQHKGGTDDDRNEAVHGDKNWPLNGEPSLYLITSFEGRDCTCDALRLPDICLCSWIELGQ